MDNVDAVDGERPQKRPATVREEDDLSPLTFYNMFGDQSADMRTLFTPAVSHAIVATMALDLEWALQHFAALLAVPSVFVASHPPRGALTTFPPNMRFAEPTCGAYGVPHGKLFCLMEPTRIRIIITTANLVETDFTLRSNAFWTQSFPRRAEDARIHDRIGYMRTKNDFGPVLLDYLRRLGVPADMLSRVGDYDFGGAAVALVASCPGVHRKAERFHFAQLRVKRILDVEGSAGAGPAISNVSSLGSVDKAFVATLAANFGATALELIWPTVEAVRQGRGGYEDGLHICGNAGNVAKAGALVKHQYRARGPEPVSPHFKSVFRLARNADATAPLQYFLLGSHNCSKSAWGRVTNDELNVASFEMGVLFLPQLLSRVAQRDVELRFAYSGDAGAMPVPYRWPAPVFSSSGTAAPWTWDEDHHEPDRFGLIYTREKNLVAAYDV